MATWYSEPTRCVQHWDIMISYQHKNKKMVTRIVDSLKKRGYSVWFDEEKLNRDIYDRMAEGVINSTVIIVCMSRLYESSPNCEREYKFAQDKGKHIIPIKMEKFQSNNALGLIIAGKLYHQFWDGINETNFNRNMKSLETDVKEYLNFSTEVTLEDPTNIQTQNNNSNNNVTTSTPSNTTPTVSTNISQPYTTQKKRRFWTRLRMLSDSSNQTELKEKDRAIIDLLASGRHTQALFLYQKRYVEQKLLLGVNHPETRQTEKSIEKCFV